jgi:hypothetical protein
MHWKVIVGSNHTKRLVIGIATGFASLFPLLVLPVLGLVLIVDLLFLLTYEQLGSYSHILLGVMAYMLWIIFLGVFCFKILQFGLKIFYVIHETRNRSLLNTYRVLFVIGTVFIPIVAMPIYYFAYFWQNIPNQKNLG